MSYKKNELYDEIITNGLMKSYSEVLELLGEDSQREGLKKTPERIAKAMQYMTQGYQMDAASIINSAKFHEDVSEMIVVKDIEIYSMCEHHMLPFIGKAHVGSGCICPKAPGTGAVDYPDKGCNKRNAEPAGCGSSY
jgi:GTP cyclohydrolase I